MLRLCPARAFMALACLCAKRLSPECSGDVGFCVFRFPAVVALAAAGVTDGFAVSLTAEGGEAFCFWTSAVPSPDSSIFDLSLYKDLSHRAD
jgi:hypothetical protein